MGATNSRPLSYHIEDQIIRLASVIDSISHFISRLFSPILGPIFSSNLGRGFQGAGGDVTHAQARRRDIPGNNRAERAKILKRKQEERKARAEAAAAGLPIIRTSTTAPLNVSGGDLTQKAKKEKEVKSTPAASAAQAIVVGAQRDEKRAKKAAGAPEAAGLKQVLSATEEAEVSARAQMERKKRQSEELIGVKRAVSAALRNRKTSTTRQESQTEAAALALGTEEEIADEEAVAAVKPPARYADALQEEAIIKVIPPTLVGVEARPVTPPVQSLVEPIERSDSYNSTATAESSNRRTPSGSSGGGSNSSDDANDPMSPRTPAELEPPPHSTSAQLKAAEIARPASPTGPTPAFAMELFSADSGRVFQPAGTSTEEANLLKAASALVRRQSSSKKPKRRESATREKEEDASKRMTVVGLDTLGRAGGLQLEDLSFASGEPAEETARPELSIQIQEIAVDPVALVSSPVSIQPEPMTVKQKSAIDSVPETQMESRRQSLVTSELGTTGHDAKTISSSATTTAQPISVREVNTPSQPSPVISQGPATEQTPAQLERRNTNRPLPIPPALPRSGDVDNRRGSQSSETSSLEQSLRHSRPPSMVQGPRALPSSPDVNSRRGSSVSSVTDVNTSDVSRPISVISNVSSSALSPVQPAMLVHRPTARRAPQPTASHHKQDSSATSTASTVGPDSNAMRLSPRKIDPQNSGDSPQSQPTIVRVPTVRPMVQRPTALSKPPQRAVPLPPEPASPEKDDRPSSPGMRTIKKGNTLTIASQLEEQIEENEEAVSELRELVNFNKIKTSPQRRSTAPMISTAPTPPPVGKASATSQRRQSLPNTPSFAAGKDHDEDERDELPPIQRPPSRTSTPGMSAAYFRPPSRGPSPRVGRGVTPPPRSSTASPPQTIQRPSSSNTWRSILRAGSPANILPDAASIFSSATGKDKEPVPVAEMADRACLRGWEASSKHRKVWKDEIERIARERCKENKSRNEQRKGAAAAAAAAARATTPDISSAASGPPSNAQKLVASYKRSQAEAALRDMDSTAKVAVAS